MKSFLLLAAPVRAVKPIKTLIREESVNTVDAAST